MSIRPEDQREAPADLQPIAGAEAPHDAAAAPPKLASEAGRGVLRVYPPSGGAHATALAECSRAFARGDFREARRLAQEVCARSPTTEEQAFAAEILKRTAIDPLALGVGLGSFALFWLTIYLTLWR